MNNLYDKAHGPGNFTVAVTDNEGGLWIAFSEWQKWRGNNKVHSIKFSDGSIWDAFNGWRPRIHGDSVIPAEGWAEAAFDKPLMYLPPRIPYGDTLSDIHRFDN